MRALLLLLFILAGCTAPPTWDAADFACDFVDAFDEPLACSRVTETPEILFEAPGRQGNECIAHVDHTGVLVVDLLREKTSLLDNPQDIPTYYVGFPAGGPADWDPNAPDASKTLTGVLALSSATQARVFEWSMPKEPHWVVIEGMEGDWLGIALWVEDIQWVNKDLDLPPLNVIYDARVVERSEVEGANWHRWIVLESEGYFTTGTEFIRVYGNNTHAPGGGLVERHYSKLPTPHGMQDILVGEWWSGFYGAIYSDRSDDGCTMTDDRIVPIPPINVQRPGLNSSIMDGVRVVRG